MTTKARNSEMNTNLMILFTSMIPIFAENDMLLSNYDYLYSFADIINDSRDPFIWSLIIKHMHEFTIQGIDYILIFLSDILLNIRIDFFIEAMQESNINDITVNFLLYLSTYGKNFKYFLDIIGELYKFFLLNEECSIDNAPYQIFIVFYQIDEEFPKPNIEYLNLDLNNPINYMKIIMLIKLLTKFYVDELILSIINQFQELVIDEELNWIYNEQLKIIEQCLKFMLSDDENLIIVDLLKKLYKNSDLKLEECIFRLLSNPENSNILFMLIEDSEFVIDIIERFFNDEDELEDIFGMIHHLVE